MDTQHTSDSSTEPPNNTGDLAVDILVIGSGTGMAAAVTAHSEGLTTLIIEKSEWVGGSTARSGGAFWVPGTSYLRNAGQTHSPAATQAYVTAAVAGTAPPARHHAYLTHGPHAIETVLAMTPLRITWTPGNPDYHPHLPGASALGRTCEPAPFDLATLGHHRTALRPTALKAPIPMPVTGADYRPLNLMAKTPIRGLTRALARTALGVGGALIGREYAAGGQATAGGLFAAVLKAGIPVWRHTTLEALTVRDGRVVGATINQHGTTRQITTRRGVILAAGGFDHNLTMRRHHHYAHLQPGWSLGADSNTGDPLNIAIRDARAATDLMDQAWWFPARAPLPDEPQPGMLLAERSLPGSFMVNGTGARFINECTEYMGFGQQVIAAADGKPMPMWLIFDAEYRKSYVFSTTVYPGQDLPASWYAAGIAHQAANPAELATKIGVPVATFEATMGRFNTMAHGGLDWDFQRGSSAFDRYYGDPTIGPNPTMRPLSGRLFAVKVVLGDLGTCGGLVTDEHGRVHRPDGAVIDGLYAVGNIAANAFGASYPGAGVTIGQGIVFGYLAAKHAAGKPVGETTAPAGQPA